jgi:hypothetical protein
VGGVGGRGSSNYLVIPQNYLDRRLALAI